VYLTTRVFEEQARIGPFAGLRRASCGRVYHHKLRVIMAGTFISMTSAVWPTILPALVAVVGILHGPVRSILELAFHSP